MSDASDGGGTFKREVVEEGEGRKESADLMEEMEMEKEAIAHAQQMKEGLLLR